MRLSINNHFLNTTYSTEDGQALYKVQTPMAWRKSSAISKLLPDNIPSSSGEPEARYGHLASIPWTAVGYCYIRMTGGDIDTRTFFHKKSRLARNRWFTGPDGREYLWQMGKTGPSLVTHDPEKKPIATFHRRKFGLLSSVKRKAYIEISSEGEHMQDLILVTWIYMEMVRQGLIHGGGKGASPSEKEQNRPLPQEQMDDDSMMADDADTDGVYVYDSG